MVPELGHFALLLAFAVALVLGVLPLAGASRGAAAWMALAAPAARAFAALVAIAWGCLVAAFVGNDFSVLLVAAHSNSELPLAYRVAASWGSHEGSMLLWVAMLAVWMAALSLRGEPLGAAMTARMLGVLGLVAAALLAFVLATSNPFVRLLPPALEGRDLNPLLQDPGMVLHPPILYMGYVGFSVAFAFAIAALLSGRFDAAWARESRPWTLAAWVFLTLGIALGSWWAYNELGWGGWWFWDPVENASFLPWLAGTALVHSLAVAEARGAFKSWTVLLAIGTFGLSLLGTFLVRSGVLSSVHAFATDPARGVFILAILVVVVGGSLALFAARARAIGLGGRFGMLSRESLLLGNNVLLCAAAGAVLLGTLYPLVLDALGLGKISVGVPYFETVFVPLFAPVVVLMGVGPLARWKEAPPRDLARALRGPAVAAAAGAAAGPWLAGRWSLGVAFGLALAAWALASTAAAVVARRGGLRHAPAAFWGLVLAHAGLGVCIVGITMVKGHEVERDVRLAVGETVTVGAVQLRFRGIEETAGPNYAALRATLDVEQPGRAPFVLQPEKRLYKVQRMPMTEAAIDAGLTGDLYVALGEPLDERTWTMRVYLKPFIGWIWAGALLMALGGCCAVGDRRWRRAAAPAAAAWQREAGRT